MYCSFCLNRGRVKMRDAETNTYCSDTDELQSIITDLQEKIGALENICAELQEENLILKAAHKDFVIDQTPSFTEPSLPPLTPPPVQLKPPHAESPDSGGDWSLKPPHTDSPDGGGGDWSQSRRVRPGQRLVRSTARPRAAKNRSRMLQPPVKKTATETADTSAEIQLPSGASAGMKSAEPQKSEKEVKERSPSPPNDVLGLSNDENQCEVVNTKVEHLLNDSGSDILGMSEASSEREEREREERLNVTPEREERLNATLEREERLNATHQREDSLKVTPEREVENRLNSPSEREERLDTPPERKVGKRRRPAVNYREEEDQDVDEPKSPPERKVVKRRRPAVNHKEEKNKDAGGFVGGGTVHCHHCEFTCLGQGRLDRHVKQRHGHLGRNGRYKCDWCEYSTDVETHITLHRRTHTGERPYRCNYCGKAFAQRSNLTTHIRIHTGQRRYVCDVCGKTFTRTNHVTRHKRIHAGEKVAECEQCGATFTDLSNYTSHMNYHNGVKNHQCQVCSARFVRRTDLSRHTRNHTEERPYA